MMHPRKQKGGFDYANCNRRDWHPRHRNSGISILGTDEGGVKNEYSITVCAVCVSQGTVLVSYVCHKGRFLLTPEVVLS